VIGLSEILKSGAPLLNGNSGGRTVGCMSSAITVAIVVKKLLKQSAIDLGSLCH
jgi:hypothetical protein